MVKQRNSRDSDDTNNRNQIKKTTQIIIQDVMSMILLVDDVKIPMLGEAYIDDRECMSPGAFESLQHEDDGKYYKDGKLIINLENLGEIAARASKSGPGEANEDGDDCGSDCSVVDSIVVYKRRREILHDSDKVAPSNGDVSAEADTNNLGFSRATLR